MPLPVASQTARKVWFEYARGTQRGNAMTALKTFAVDGRLVKLAGVLLEINKIMEHLL